MQAEQTEKSQAVDCCWDAQRQEMIGQTTIYFLGHLFKDKNRAFASRCHLTTATRMPWGKLLCSVFFSFVKNCSCVTHLHYKACSEMHFGSCSQIMSSCKCPIKMLFVKFVCLFVCGGNWGS